MNVLQYYEKTLADRGYRADEAQQRAIARLQVFADELVTYQQELAKPFRRFLSIKPGQQSRWMSTDYQLAGRSLLLPAMRLSSPAERRRNPYSADILRNLNCFMASLMLLVSRVAMH